nr:HNH endonuclease [Candidatus Latescibacterota bacterium]
LGRYGGAQELLRIERVDGKVRFSFGKYDGNRIHEVPLYTDKLSQMDYFFTTVPIEFLHHDDRINPRSIGANIRGLIEEFIKKRPQLHVGLAWWAPEEEEGAGKLKLFDGQHKAAAQILLGVQHLPVRVFLNPDTNVLLQANTNAGGKRRQVAFDAAVMRHLGSTLYLERLRQYQSMRGLPETDYSFSEQDLVKFFRGERREMERYIVDSWRDQITHNPDNRLLEFVEWAGKGTDRPLSYATLERTFFAILLYKSALDSPIDEGMEQGTNPRILERDQMVRLMSLFAEVFFVNKWDPEVGGRRLENRMQKGETIPEDHLRAWRVAREEVLRNIVEWVQLVISNYFAYMGKKLKEDKCLQTPLPDTLWQRIETFLRNLAKLPCWIDTSLSTTVFGPKQNSDDWAKVFDTGLTPNGIRILAQGLDLQSMIQENSGS